MLQLLHEMLCLHSRAQVTKTWNFYEHHEDEHPNERHYVCQCPDCGARYEIRARVARPSC